jgi:hypothetical protein
MIEKLKESWEELRASEPGYRFQTRYSNHRKRRKRRERGEVSRYGRLLDLLGGPAPLIVAGLAFLPTPSPSCIIIVVGLWMLAGKPLILARLFDRVEVGLRRAADPGVKAQRRRRHPKRASDVPASPPPRPSATTTRRVYLAAVMR